MYTAIVSRATNLITAPFKITSDFVEGSLSLVSGIAHTALAIMSLGLIEEVNDYAHFDATAKFLPKVYMNLIQILNPNAEAARYSFKRCNFTTYSRRMGYLTRLIAKPCFKSAVHSALNDNSPMERHVFSRLAYLGGAVVAVFTRTLDLIVGAFLAIAGAFALGSEKKLNMYAIEHLTSLDVLYDLSVGIRGFINPQSVS